MNTPQLRFPEFNDEWKVSTYGKHLDIKSGYGFKASEYSEDGVPLIKIDNVSHGKIIWDNTSYLPKFYLNKYPDLSLDEGDILLALNRPITRNKLKIGMLKKEDSPSILYQRVGKIIFNTKDLDKKFVYYLLCVKIYRFVIKNSVGSDQPFISVVKLKKMYLTFPKRSEQQKIASFLSKVDEKIELLEKKLKLWEKYKKGIMQQLFSQKLRFKDENDQDYPDWEEKKFNEIFDFLSSNSFSRADLNYELGDFKNIHYGDIHTKFATILDCKSTEIPFINENINLDNINMENHCNDGDLIIADASEDYDDIGKSVELKNVENKLLAGLHTLLVRDNKGFTVDGYRGYMMQDFDVRLQLMRFATGVSVLGISKKNLSQILLKIPSVNEQRKIADFLTQVEAKLEKIHNEININKEFKKGLLQQMFC